VPWTLVGQAVAQEAPKVRLPGQPKGPHLALLVYKRGVFRSSSGGEEFSSELPGQWVRERQAWPGMPPLSRDLEHAERLACFFSSGVVLA
jgi:hypothetical protein